MDKKLLEKLYLIDGLSMQEIADRQRCSLNKVYYWMKKTGVKVRSREDAIYLKLNPEGDPFSTRQLKSSEEFLLLGLGLGLWWGEGSKLHKGVIRLGNSDPRLINKFIQFLEVVFNIKRSKIKLGLQIFDDQNPEDVKKAWLHQLNLPETCFLPTVVVTEKRGKGTYKRLNKWGVLTVYFSNVKLRKILDQYMETYVLN